MKKHRPVSLVFAALIEALEPRTHLTAAPNASVDAIEIAPTGDFAVSSPSGKFTAAVLSGSRQKGGAKVVVTYNGIAVLKNAVVTTTLYASATQIDDDSAIQIGKAVVKKVGKLKPGETFRIHFAPFAYPGTPGTDYLVSDVALNGVLDSYDGATSAPINVQGAFVDADALAATPTKPTLVAGKKAFALFTIKNLGNIAIVPPATFDAGLVPAGSAASTTPTFLVSGIPLRFHLNAGQTKKFRVSFTPTTLPASGTYNLALEINVPGDATASNDTVFSAAVITI